MAGLSKTKQIEKKFGAHIAGNKEVKRLVSEAISLFPKELVNYIIKNIWFAASFDDAWAFTFDGNDLKGKHLIFLSDDLLAQSRYQIFHSIAHEISHVVLGHRNTIYIQRHDSQRGKTTGKAGGRVC